jgi:hypothetical protein
MAKEKPEAKREVVPRISITLPSEVRAKIRLAAALRDMEPGEWCKTVLVSVAKRTVEKYYPDLSK